MTAARGGTVYRSWGTLYQESAYFLGAATGRSGAEGARRVRTHIYRTIDGHAQRVAPGECRRWIQSSPASQYYNSARPSHEKRLWQAGAGRAIRNLARSWTRVTKRAAMHRISCTSWCAWWRHCCLTWLWGTLLVGLLVQTEVFVQGNQFSPQDVPGPPEKVLVSPFSDSSMRVQFLPPVRTKAEGNNGAPVLGYKVEVAQRVNDVHTFTVEANGPVTSASYKMTFTNAKGTEVTACIPWNATEIMFEMALEELPNVDHVSVTRSEYNAAKFGYVYTITFDGKNLVSGSQPNPLVGDQVGCAAVKPLNRVLTFTGVHVSTGARGYQPEIWEIVTQDTAGTSVVGGSFDLSVGFNGDWVPSGMTATIAPGSRTAVTTAAMSMIGKVNRGDVIKIGGEEFTVHLTAPFTDTELPLDTYHIRGTGGQVPIYIRDTALGDVAVTLNSAEVMTSADFSASLAVGEHIKIGKWEFKVATITASKITIDKIDVGNAQWPEASVAHITAYKRKKVNIDANADALEVQRSLNSLPGVGIVEVSRVGPTQQNGYRWLVTFESLGRSSNCDQSPCLRADKVTGSATLLTDAYGSACLTCVVKASLLKDESNTAIVGIDGEYVSTSIIATREIGGTINEVQSISTAAMIDDIRGTFAVNFRNTFSESVGATINYYDTAADVRTKLQNLPTVGRLNVTRVSNDQFGYTWMVTFLANTGDQPLFLIDASGLSGTGVSVVAQERQKGVEVPFEAVVEGLSSSRDYYIRAFARNMNGYGSGTEIIQSTGKGALPLTTHIATAPSKSAILSPWPVSGTEVGLFFAMPDARGSPIQKYQVEYAIDSSFGVAPIKSLYVYNPIANDTVGTFRVQYGDALTPLLTIQATAADMVRALGQISRLRPVQVSRAPIVVYGTISFVANNNRLTTPSLTALQCGLLATGTNIKVGRAAFIVKTQPVAGAIGIEVQSGHGVADFAAAPRSVVILDPTGSAFGANGYEWTITFVNEIEDVVVGVFPGLQVVSQLSSVEAGSTLSTYGLISVRSASPPAYYGALEVSNDKARCDSYVIGAPSAVQVLQLFAPTTITQGTFKLQLGPVAETTGCISLGTTAIASDLAAKLQALQFVERVSVQELRMFKVALLFGSSTSSVSAYSAASGSITVSPLTADQAKALAVGTIIQVSRNPNDFSRHSCEFSVTTAPAAGAVNVVVAPAPTTTCADFNGETRSLKILDFHDYRIRFWGSYPTGEWPTLKVVQSSFGKGGCTAWAPAVPVYSTVHTVKYEGKCAHGRRGTQTILADALSTIGGSFTLSYRGKETTSLPFQTTTASKMREAIESITQAGSVNVTLSQYGSRGLAWRITFISDGEGEDLLFIKHSYLTGQDAYISVYPTVEIYSDAKRDDISGTFRLTFGGQTTEAIGFTATHAKVVQELQKLSVVDSVVALGATGDIGVSTLTLTATATGGSPVLTGIQLNGKAIDPTLFLAIREKLVINAVPYSIKAITPVDVTLTANFAGVTGAVSTVTIAAGAITKQTKPLPGRVSISRLMQIVTATKGTKIFELPSDHGYVQGGVFYVQGNKFTVDNAAGQFVTTLETYTGDDIKSASPEVYLFDNRLRTTEDLSSVLAVNDAIWLQTVAGDMIKYTVSGQVNKRYIPVDGTFTDSIVGSTAFAVSYGRKWTLVFRSYTAELETIDALPQNDWRGTDVRLGARHPTAVPPLSLTIGNDAEWQTVLLDAPSPADAANAKYTLSFGAETTQSIDWTEKDDALKTKLEALIGIDGVTVTSLAWENGFLHTIKFWGMYTMPKLPTLVGKVTTANPKCSILVRDKGDVSHTKQDHLILKNNQDVQLRMFAVNEKGISAASDPMVLQTTTSSIVPTPPTSVVLGEYHSTTWLSVNYRPPMYTGGGEITMYRLEWDSSPTFDSASPNYGVASIQKRFEVQQITTSYRSNVNSGGTFTLAWGGRVTTPLPFDCSAAQMTDALAVITDTTNIAVNPVKVVRAQASWGYSWTITFLHTPGNLALLVADGSLLTGDFPRIAVKEIVQGFSDLAIGDFTHEVQDVFTDATTKLTGTFKLEFEGKVTQAMSVDASALEMQDALQSLTTLYSIKVSRTSRNTAMNTAIWSVTFAYLKGEEMVGAGDIFLITVADMSALSGTAASVRIANKIVGSDPFRYTITGLQRGTRYYMHAMAYNSEGFGSATSPLSTAVTCGQPDPPKSVVASVVDGKTLAVSWTSSDSDGGCPVDKYKVEWYRGEGTQEQQTVTTSAGKGLPDIQRVVDFADSQSLGGFFKLSFGGETTENIAWNAPPVGLNSVKARLERLSSVGTVDVSRQPSIRVVPGLFVTASGNTITQDPTSTSSIATSGLSAGDLIWILGKQLTIDTITAPTLTVKETLTTTLAVPVFKTAFGFDWRITFQAGHVGPQELLKVAASDSWAGNNPGIYVESVQRGLQPISGTFRVSFASGGLSHITQPLPYNVSADGMKDALQNLVTIGLVNVTRSTNGFGFNWLVTFVSEVKDEISLLGVDGTELHGPSVRISAAITDIGVQPDFYCETKEIPGGAAIVDQTAMNRFVIGGLKTGQKYSIRVRAHNVEGYGGARLISPSFQIPRTTPTAPVAVKLIVLSSRLLKVRWDPPVSDGGSSITSYKIQWDLSGRFSDVDAPVYDMRAELSVQPSDTSPFFYNIAVTAAGTYFARVIAVNDQGPGVPALTDPESATPVDRTPGQPENVRATVLSSYAILVEWDASTIQKPYYGGNGGLPITQYMIEWDSSSAFDSPASFGLVSGSQQSFIIGGNDPVTGVRSNILIPGTIYSMRVTAFNAKGAGPPRMTTPPTVIAANQVPTVPRNLQLSVIPATSIKATWENPMYDGGLSLKSYQVQWDEQDDFSSGQSDSATIPIVREIQSLTVSTDVVNEEQFVDATVEVINEVQVVRTIFTGADEIQVIKTDNAAVVDEVQMVTTSATDRDEVQELRLDAPDVNEIQAVRTTVSEVLEVQTIKVGVVRQNEQQTFSLTFPGRDVTKITGSLFLTFDTSNDACTHCTLTKVYQRTLDLIGALQTTDNDVGAGLVESKLEALDNIDSVTVTRTSSQPPDTTLTYTFTVTFSGDEVAGQVPLLGIESALKYNNVDAIVAKTQATRLVSGAEVASDPASIFKVTHTCESYSDPTRITTFSDDCTPTVTLCASCVTAFDGSAFTITIDLTATVSPGDRLIAGGCVFEVDSGPANKPVTATAIPVLPGDVGTLCSSFSDQALPLYRAKQLSVPILVKEAATKISDWSYVQGQLNTIIKSVVVARTQVIEPTFVGSLYTVTFYQRSGTIPSLLCDSSAIKVTASTSVCIVARTVKGSMISGTFTLKLPLQSDSTVFGTTAAIPWDASEGLVKKLLEDVTVTNNGITEQVFGTVSVTRSVYAATANKWSGGFTWKIEFTSRGWNIPTMTVLPSLGNTNAGTPSVAVEDFKHPFDPYAGSVDGYQIAGTITLKFGGVSSGPFTIGVNTDITMLHTTVTDTKLQDFIVAAFPTTIPSIKITRSAATQARGFTWTITFSDKETGGDVPMLELTSNLGATDTAKMYETVKGNQLGGTFQLKFNGETTGPILFSADQTAVQAQLNNLASIKPSSVVVSRTGPDKVGAQVLSYTWFITFTSSVWADPTSDHSNGIAGNWIGARAKWDDVWPETGYSKAWGRQVGPMWSNNLRISCIKDGLTTTANDNTQDCRGDILTPGVGPIKGTFTLTLDSTFAQFMAVKDIKTSVAIAHNAWATKAESGSTGTSVEEILEQMGNVGDVAVSRSVVNKLTGGYTWTVTFLRDKIGLCEQEEDNTNGVSLCNAPGDVPAMTADKSTLSGSASTVIVCEKTTKPCIAEPFAGVLQNGLLLRGDFTRFKVTNDPGFDQRYSLKFACANTYPNCIAGTLFDVPLGSANLVTQLLIKDRFTIGEFTTCVLTVKNVNVGAKTIEVESFATAPTCAALVALKMANDAENSPRGVFIRVPWNADENLIKRVLEASSDDANEIGVWSGGRKVSVKRTIHGKYGEVSWQVQFISNPTFTPPGAGNIPDIAPVFGPNPVVPYQITVTQITPGSVGLTGSFMIDFRSTIGPREIRFDETESRLERKLNEMNTIGRVTVKKMKYPSKDTGCMDSTCSGGWDDQPVDNPGTRGGYRWRVRFMKVTGEYGGLTFPSGSGNVNPLSVTLGTLQGNEKSIDVTTNLPGSPPILGGFILNTSTKATPTLPYSSSADSIKQGIQAMNLFGEVDVTQDVLLTQRIPNAVAAVSKDGLSASITGIDDIRQFFAPGDLVRFGPIAASNLVGSNGDSPFTDVLVTSTVSVAAMSPIVQAVPASTKKLFPGMKLRIDGLVYTVKRSSWEVQTMTLTLPATTWTPGLTEFKMTLSRGGATFTSACLTFDAPTLSVEGAIVAILKQFNPAAQDTDVKVTRRGPISTTVGGVAHTGYVYSVYFLGDSVAGNVATLLVDTTTCTQKIATANAAVAVVTHGGVIPQQRISLATDSGQVVDSTGYFKLTLGGVTSPSCLSWGISAEDLELHLEDKLKTGDVLVARRGSGQSVTEIQRLRMTSNTPVTSPATGLFQLALTLDGETSVTSACLAYGVSAADMQTALNQLDNIKSPVPHVNVTRAGDGTSSWGYGYEYTISYRGPISGGYSRVLGNVNPLRVVNIGTGPCVNVAGGEPALILETVREGAAGFTYDIYFLDFTTAYTPKLAIATGDCATGWTHMDGSVRKAWVDVVEIGGSGEVQSVTINSATPGASTYKLTFGGASTACLPFNAKDDDVRVALVGLPKIGTSGVFVSRDLDPVAAPNGFVYKVTFIGDLTTGDVPPLGVDFTGCTGVGTVAVAVDRPGGVAPGLFVTTKLYDGERPDQQHIVYSVGQVFSVMNEQIEIQTIAVKNAANDITATATFKLVFKTLVTKSIKWNAAEYEVEDALKVVGVDDGDITVTRRTDATAAPNGYVYTVYFSGKSVSGNLAEMTVDSKAGFGTGTVTIATVKDGVDNIPALFEKSVIPLALTTDASSPAPYIASGAALSVFKVNGFLWTIKFKSTIGNIPALVSQSDGLTGKLTVNDDFVPGSASNTYTMTNLMSGIPYYVRVAASTDIGMGAFTSIASKIPSGVASPVKNIAAGYALNAQEVQEVRLAATHITEIQEIATSAAKMAEVQTLRTYASADTCFDNNCVKGAIAFRVPTIQTITVAANGPITAGSFSIGFIRYISKNDGTKAKKGTVYDTAKIAWNADASEVATAMAALDGVDASDIIVTRDGDESTAFNYGYVFSVTFIGNSVAGETEMITIKDKTNGCTSCDPFVTTGNVGYSITVAMNSGQAMGTDTAVQEIIVTAKKPLYAGSYQLKLNHLGAEKTSDCINFDAVARGSGDPRAMESILMKMDNIDKVYVTRVLDPDRAPNGFVYRVFFYGNVVSGPINTMTFAQCVPFQTLENNVLVQTGVLGAVSISTIDPGGFDTKNAFVDASSATATKLEEDLDRLPVFGDVIVTRSLADEQGGFVWTVAFKDSEGNLPQFICAVDGVFTATVGTGCETATLTDGNAISGSFVVDSSVPIAFDASATAMKSALEAMAWVGTVQVVRTGPSAQMGYAWTITFLDYFGDVPPLAVTSSLVATASAITVREVRKGNSIGGTFTLKYLSSVTDPIAWNAKASSTDSGGDGTSVEEKLEALSVIGPLKVTQSAMDQEGGYTWLITFLDNNLNPGDLPLLQADATKLTGEGVVAATREIVKGSNAVGNQLWLSFDPPVSDNGSPITKYLVRWDTAATFTANPGEFGITEPEKLYQIQRVETSAPSLAWSRTMPGVVNEVQTLTISAVANAPIGTTFTLSFRGISSAQLTVGTSTGADLQAALNAVPSVGSVSVASLTDVINPSAKFTITFTSKPGDLPLLVPTPTAVAIIDEITKGVTNFRKEVLVLQCKGTTGAVKFDNVATGASQTIAFDATLAIISTQLHALFGVDSGSIRVLSTQLVMCAVAPVDITIIFDRVKGDINMQWTPVPADANIPTDLVITKNALASIDGVFNDVSTKMSGTFQVGYNGEYTRALNAESSALDVRYALEDLSTIDTVAVDRTPSFQPLSGKLDVVNGGIFATCSAGETCNFRRGGYGLPGSLVMIGGTWYTVLAGQASQDELESSALYLGDLNGREVGYAGATATGVTAYEWTRGYVWSVYMLRVNQPLTYLRAKIPRLYPIDSTVKVSGSSCNKCYYLPMQTTKTLVMGQLYFIDVTAFNENGKGQSTDPVSATPSQVPNAPSNVDLAVLSGQEIEVFFSPPALASMNVNPNFNNDISSYIVQWDVKNDFKHGLTICSSCAVSLKENTITVSQSLVTMVQAGTKLTIGTDSCVLKVASVQPNSINVVAGHLCNNFNARSYALFYYTYPPAVLSGLLIQGSPPFRYTITGLVVATKYFVRVAAVNSVPVQQIALSGIPPNNRKWSFPLSATTKDTVPDPPISVFLYPFSGTTLELQIQPSTRDGKGQGGLAITHFWIDIDTVSTFDSATKAAPIEVAVAGGTIPLLYVNGPRMYYLKNLQTGVNYFVQVKAKNAIGYSRATLAPNPLAPTRNPDGPVNVKVSTVTSSPMPIDAATVVWQPPITNGGLPITSYRIEWWAGEPRPEIQVVEIKWTTTPTEAPFTLSFAGRPTGYMTFDIKPENLRSALMNVFDVPGVTQLIQHVEVSRSTINMAQGYQWRVTFLGDRNAGNQPMLQFAFGTIKGGAGVTGRVYEAQSGIAVPQPFFPGKREVQVLVTSHASVAVGGYFRLSYKGSAWSNYLSATIASADLKLALEALATVGKVTVGDPSISQNGFIWTITFDSVVGNLPGLIVDSSKITPVDAFVGVKDGDNAVDTSGRLCLPGDPACPGTWGTFTTGIAALAVTGEAASEYNFYETIDATSFTYKITGLQAGRTYYVAVTAKNALGLGVRVKSAPGTIIPPIQAPSVPTQVSVDVNPGVATQLTATWSAPTSNGGNEVRLYRVEYDPSPLFKNRGVEDFFCPSAPTSAVWRVATARTGNTDAPIANGFFNLILTRQNAVLKTEPIPWNAVAMAKEEAGDATPAKSKVFCVDCPGCVDTCPSQATYPYSRREQSGSLQSKLEYLSTLNSVQIVRSPMAPDGGFVWTITFNDVGDDFVLTPDVPNSLTCVDNGATCTKGVYTVTTTKVTAGVANSVCTGTKVIPTTGALNKGQLYYVRVFAFNKVGFSLPGSAPSPQKPMVVPGPPTGVTLQVMSVSELKVIFSPPDDNGGDTIVEYLVEWSTTSAFTNVQSGPVVLLAGGAPYYRVISNLVKGQFYFVRVKAKNSQGYGQYQISSPRSLNPYTTPSAPTKVTMGTTASTMLTVQWNIPDDDGGDAITGYIVQWDISAGFDSLSVEATKAKIDDVSQRSYTITLLTPGTVYYVRVFAVNSGGPGTAQTTTPVSLVPTNTRPGKPHTLQVAPTTVTGELLVSWQMPRIPAHGIPCSGTLLMPLACPIYVGFDVVYGGSSFGSYMVHYSDNSDFTGFEKTSVTTTSALLTGLTSGKLYYVRVLTENAEGQKSDFCQRANANNYLCPDNLVLLDGTIITGSFVSATPK